MKTTHLSSNETERIIFKFKGNFPHKYYKQNFRFLVWITMKRLISIVYCCSLWNCTTFLRILTLIVFYCWFEHLEVLQSIFKLSGLIFMWGIKWFKHLLWLCLELMGLGNRSLALQKKVTLNCNYCISRVVILQNPTPGYWLCYFMIELLVSGMKKNQIFFLISHLHFLYAYNLVSLNVKLF